MCVDIIVICCNFEFMRGGNVDCGLALYGVDFLLVWYYGTGLHSTDSRKVTFHVL